MKLLFRIGLALILSFAVTTSAIAQSEKAQRPSAKQPTKQDQRGTEQQPFVVKAVPPVNPKDETEREQESLKIAGEMRNIANQSRVIAFCMLLLAGLQAGLFVRQLSVIKRNAQIAETNSRIALEQFLASHRPKLLIRQLSLKRFGEGPQSLGVEYTIVNTGNTAGVVVEISEKLWHEQSGSTVENFPPRPSLEGPKAVHIEIESGEAKMTFIGNAAILADFDFSSGFIEASGPHSDTTGSDLLFIGYITYEDSSKRRRTTGFLRKYNYVRKRFEVVDDPDYEYAD